MKNNQSKPGYFLVFVLTWKWLSVSLVPGSQSWCAVYYLLIWSGMDSPSGTYMDKWQVDKSLQIKSSSPGWENFHKNSCEKMLPMKGWNNISLKQAIHFSHAKSGTHAVYQPTSFDSSRGLSWICCRISWPTKPIKPTQKPKLCMSNCSGCPAASAWICCKDRNHCFVFYVVRLPIFFLNQRQLQP